MKLEGIPRKKNVLIRRLSFLTGNQVIYNGAPDFTYDIGPYRVESSGAVCVFEEEADAEVLNTLFKEKLLKNPNPGLPLVTEAAAQAVPAVPVNGVAGVNTEEASAPADLVNTAEPRLPEPNPSRREINKPIVITETVIDVKTMINLLNMIASKGELLNRVVGEQNAFYVSGAVLADIEYDRPGSFPSLSRRLRDTERNGLVRGIKFTANTVSFPGFPKTKDPVLRMSYERLARAMYDYAAKMKWISSKGQEIVNEKYSFRSWINHLGLSGKENKTCRMILMQNLGGISSFRTASQLNAYRSKRDEKKKEEAAAAARASTVIGVADSEEDNEVTENTALSAAEA